MKGDLEQTYGLALKWIKRWIRSIYIRDETFHLELYKHNIYLAQVQEGQEESREREGSSEEGWQKLT